MKVIRLPLCKQKFRLLLHIKTEVLLVADENRAVVNSIIARKLATTRLLKEHPVSLSAIESDILLQNLTLRRCYLQKKCLCPAHLSLMMKERKIEVSG
jgi:hypothetical protein